jgi:hypothetical protein
MGLRERILEPLDIRQRVVFALIFVLSLLLSVAGELIVTSYYYFQVFHAVIVFGAIQLVINPQGIRLLFFLIFSYLLIKIFALHYDHDQDFYWLNPDELMFGYPMYLIGFSQEVLIYSHVVLYALLAYFAINNPFKQKKHRDSEVLDQVDKS